jgi:transposase-like protein
MRPEQVEELVTGYQTGLTVYQLAEQFRIDRGTVSRLLERQGVHRRGRPLSQAQIEQATELYATGLSLVSVGKRLGCDGSTVHLALRKAGVRMRDCQGRER